MTYFGSRGTMALVGAVALIVTGCALATTTPPPTGPTAPSVSDPARSASASPSTVDVPTDASDPACGDVPVAVGGEWTKTIRPKDLPPELFDMDTGVFVMTLGPGRYMRVDVDDDHRGTATELCWTTDKVAFVGHRDDCSGDAFGAFTWTLGDDELDFTTLVDECAWRVFPMTVDSWHRVEG